MGKDHLDRRLKQITSEEGEGLMLKDPDCAYEHRRSPNLLKVKIFHDAEAEIIGH